MTNLYLGRPTKNITKWINKKLPLYFEALGDCNIKLTASKEISLLYSFDNKTWNDWDYTTGTNLSSFQKLYLKSKTNPSYPSNCSYHFITSFIVNVAGNAMSLYYNDFSDKDFSFNSMFFGLFKNCDIIDASDLILPATKMDDLSYQAMFMNCTTLVAAPELPATITHEQCYCDMFNGCTSLVYAPKLPAKVLDNDMEYYDMFKNCLAIKELHYPKSLQNDSEFMSMAGAPWFGALNATIYFDL